MIELHMTNGETVRIHTDLSFEDAMTAISRAPGLWQVDDKCVVRTDHISIIYEVSDDE